MKKILILVLILNFACSNDDITEIQNNGTGGISCLVNGQVLKPKTNSVFGPSTQYFKIYEDQGITYINVGFYNKNSNSEWKIVDIYIPNIEYRDSITNQINSLVGTYNLKENNGTNSYGTYDINVLDNFPTYTTTEDHNGELKIDYHDIDNFIVSGTFWFNAVDENGEIVEIREGRFDKEINN
ncbi:DUF6252 family protein [Xanthomarina gelatinilytica]|uniref:DUF6252 family protein n=1 Tax=Xanthomarina gelatinilytica TaxID=1137281 RepID=UPI003AA9DAD3